MRVDVTPDTATVAAGEAFTFFVTVVNTEPIISAHRVTVLGADPTWVELDQEQLSLFPDAAGVVTVTIRLPAGIPAGTRRLAVQVREVTAPGDIQVVEVPLVVPAAHGTRVELEPPSFSGGSKATVGVVLINDGNADAEIHLSGTDADQALRFEFEPPGVRLAPGERATIATSLKGRRPITGSPRVRQLTIAADPVGAERVAAIGTFVQRPLLSRGALGLVGLLAAISVFAGVIATTFGKVVDTAQDNRDLVLEALRSGSAGGEAAGTSGLGGTVTLLTDGTAVAGVTVELFAAGDIGVPIANAATGDDGTYAFEGLAAGRYKLRYRAAGFAELWYPAALEPDDAQDVEIAPDEVRDGVDIRLGGVPGSIAGMVIGDDPAGAVVSVRLPVDLLTTSTGAAPVDPLTAPVVASAVVDATGTFLIPGLPSPSVYDVLVQQEGFASEVQRVNLSAGEERTGLEITLRRGDGTISGRVFDAAGVLGGATISASDGSTTVTTVSLTRDDVGAYTLRALPTPATYTLVISAPGHVTETLTVTLGPQEERPGVDATLRSDAGSIAGRVSVSGGGAPGGVRVVATDGETTVETITLSTGDVGSYTLNGLPVPGTYTVSFQREDLTPQTRAVDLDDLGTQDVTGVDATLVPASASVHGTVRDAGECTGDECLLGEVEVVLTSGDRTFRTMTASQPRGAYEVIGLPPGTYSVSFQRSGSEATALLVTLRPGERRTLDATLAPRASITGVVFVAAGAPSTTSSSTTSTSEFDPTSTTTATTAPPATTAPAAGAQVRLFLAESFPNEPIAVAIADASGRFTFDDLDAPRNYVLDFATGSGEPPQQSRSVVLGPGEDRDLSTDPTFEPVVLQP